MTNKGGFYEKPGDNRWKDYNLIDFIIIISTFLSFFIISLFHYMSVVTVVPNLLYIPIILFAYRYPKKGILFAAILSVSYLIVFDVVIEPVSASYVDAIGRTLIFVAVSGVVSYLSVMMQSEKNRYQDLFNNLSDAVFICEKNISSDNADIWYITGCNHMACEFLGYKKKELCGMHFKDLLVPEDREKMNPENNNKGCCSPEVIRITMIKKDGKKIQFELNSHTYDTGKKTVYIAVAHDIQKRLKAEKKVLESRWKLEESQNIAHLGYWEMNVKTGIQTWSEETFRIFRMTPTSDMKVSFGDFIEYVHPDFRDILISEYERSVHEKSEFSLEYKIFRGDGELRWIHSRCRHYTDKNGRIIYTLGVHYDNTKDVLAEKKIAEQAKFFETLLETIPLPVFYKDKKGIYLGCNQAFANLIGKSKEDIIGKTVHSIFDEKTAEAQSERDSLIYKMSGIQIYETEIPRKNMTSRSMISSKAVIRDKNGDPNLIIGVMQDITDIKKTKENLKKSLEEKNVLLQEVHHRVKNNLAAISGILEIEKSRIKDEDALCFLNEAESRIQSMVIVHESLYHSGNFGEMDAEEHFRHLFESVLISYSPPVDISLEIETSGCKIDINSAIPCSLVTNEILTNSMKYAFSGMDRGKVKIEFQCAGDEYTLVIADDGCGVSDDIIPEKSPTLGMKVILNIVRLQLMGNVSLSGNDGTKWVIKWPKKSPE